MVIYNLTSIPLYVMQSDQYGLPTATAAQTISVNGSVSVSQTGEFYIGVKRSDSTKLIGKQLATNQSQSTATAAAIQTDAQRATRPTSLHVYYLSEYTDTDGNEVKDYYCLNGLLDTTDKNNIVTFAEITPPSTNTIALDFSDCFAIDELAIGVLNTKEYISGRYGTTETDSIFNHIKFHVVSGKKLTSDISFGYFAGGRNFSNTITNDATQTTYESILSWGTQREFESYDLTADSETAAIDITLVNNTKHATVVMLPTGAKQGDQITVTVLAYDKYYFKTPPTLNGVAFTETQSAGSNPNRRYRKVLSATDTANITTVTVDGIPAQRVVISKYSTLTNCSYKTTPTNATLDEALTITVTANSGYDFIDSTNNNLYARVVFEGGGYSEYYPTLNDAKTVATFRWSAAEVATFTTATNVDTVSLYCEAASSDRSVSISGTKQDCVVTWEPKTIDRKQSIVFTFTANSGYYFTTAPTVNVVTTAGGVNSLTSTLQNHGLSATLTLSTTDTANASTLDYSAIATTIPSITVDVNSWDGHLDSATYEVAPKNPKKGDNITVVVTALDSYWFRKQNPTANGEPMTISDDFLSATVNYTANESWNLSKIDIKAVAVKQPIQIHPTGETSSCNVTFPNIILQGDTVTFLFVANDGYYFVETPTVTVTDVNTTTETFTGELTNDNTQCAISVVTKQTTQTIEYYAIAQINPDVPQISYSFLNGYVVSNENLKELAKVRFVEQTSTTTLVDASKSSQLQTTVSNELIDLGQYVTSLRRFYVDMPTSIDATVVLGTMDTKVKAKLLAADTVEIDCGTVHINENNRNVNDYNNTTVRLFLPFIGMMTLDADLIMNKDVNIKYKVSTISGACIATISTGTIPLFEYTGNVSERIPYIMNYNEATMLNSYFDVQANTLYDFTPVILVVYHPNINPNNSLIIPFQQYANRIQTLQSGKYYRVDDVTLLTDTTTLPQSIPNDELDMIIQVLQNGFVR